MTKADPREDAEIPLSVGNHPSHPGLSRQRVMIPVDGVTRSMFWFPVPFSVEPLVAGRRPPRITGSSSRRESFQPIHDSIPQLWSSRQHASDRWYSSS